MRAGERDFDCSAVQRLPVLLDFRCERSELLLILPDYADYKRLRSVPVRKLCDAILELALEIQGNP